MKLVKENKVIMIVTSIIVLIPILIGLIYWNELPQEIATHFGMNDEPNGWSSKEFTVFGIPIFLLIVHWLCALGVSADPKNNNLSKKMYNIVLWICPLVSVICAVSIYGYELGWNVGASQIAKVFMAMVFIVVGNYLPKCRQNYTVGIKLPWTLSSEENWNKTHRLAGKLWVVVGLFMVINVFFDMEGLILAFILISVLIPSIYSYMLYKKSK